MPNTNCLKGFSCPDCRSEAPFNIGVTAIVTFFDNGPIHPPGYEFHAGSYCECPTCGRIGIVKQFRAGKG
jgi:hypothetical protein